MLSKPLFWARKKRSARDATPRNFSRSSPHLLWAVRLGRRFHAKLEVRAPWTMAAVATWAGAAAGIDSLTARAVDQERFLDRKKGGSTSLRCGRDDNHLKV